MKIRRTLGLMAALATLAGGTMTMAVAQDAKKKTDDKKPAPETKKADEKKLGSIEYYKNEKMQWRYIIKDENGKSIVMPLAQIHFESKEECLKEIEFLKDTLAKVKPTERAEKK